MELDNYDFSNSLEAEQFNTLLLLDKVLGDKHLSYIPEFHILGGTALLFHGISSVATIDIDIVNEIKQEVKDAVEPFISDNAKDVTVLPLNYIGRMLVYKPECFKHINVFILSAEDLVITKLAAGRHKDIEDLRTTPILEKCDMAKLRQIIQSELDSDNSKLVMSRLSTLV